MDKREIVGVELPKEGNDSKEEKRGKKLIIVILLILLLMLLLSRCLVGEFNNEIKDGTFSTQDEDLLALLKEKQDASKFTTNIVPEAIYDRKENILSLKVANPERNTIDCIVKIELDGDCYYTSGLMKPNQYIDEVVLDKPLPNDCDTIYVSYNEKLAGNKLRLLTTVEVHCTDK